MRVKRVMNIPHRGPLSTPDKINIDESTFPPTSFILTSFIDIHWLIPLSWFFLWFVYDITKIENIKRLFHSYRHQVIYKESLDASHHSGIICFLAINQCIGLTRHTWHTCIVNDKLTSEFFERFMLHNSPITFSIYILKINWDKIKNVKVT